MVVTEIFRSIQGESTFAGLPCIFVRLTGCNLRCVWCDTAYAFYGGERRSIEEVIREMHRLADGADEEPVRKIRLAEITGGEPLLQAETPELARRLLEDGFTVLVETSGERDIRILPPGTIRIMDVKCPDSGEFGKFEAANVEALNERDEVKFVIASRRDYEFARDFLQENALAGRVRQVLFAPVLPEPAGKWAGLEARELASWVLEDRLPVRMNLQLHKFIWEPAARGV